MHVALAVCCLDGALSCMMYHGSLPHRRETSSGRMHATDCADYGGFSAVANATSCEYCGYCLNGCTNSTAGCSASAGCYTGSQYNPASKNCEGMILCEAALHVSASTNREKFCF